MTVADIREVALRDLCRIILDGNIRADESVEDRLQSARMVAAECIRLLDEHATNAARPLPDHDNHHNAAVCPYCTDNGKYVLVAREDVRVLLDGTNAKWDGNEWRDVCARLRKAIS